MKDETEGYRRFRQEQLNREAAERAKLEEQYGQVWSTDELRDDFEVVGFMAPIVIVRNRATGEQGSLEFQHSPRFYFNFAID
jgi:hypothetical protein